MPAPVFKCKRCGAVKCYCCPECGRNVASENHAPRCSLKPKPVTCVACEGMGRSSNNRPCVPCGGTGLQGKGKLT